MTSWQRLKKNKIFLFQNKKDMFNKPISNKINILEDKLFNCQMIKDKLQQITYNIALDEILRDKTGQKLQLDDESQLTQI